MKILSDHRADFMSDTDSCSHIKKIKEEKEDETKI